MERKDVITLAAILGSLIILSPVIQAIFIPRTLNESSHSVSISIDSSIPAYLNGTLVITSNDGNRTFDVLGPATIQPFSRLTTAITYTLTYAPMDYQKLGPFLLNSMESYVFHDPTQTLTIRCEPVIA